MNRYAFKRLDLKGSVNDVKRIQEEAGVITGRDMP
jgi:hypothetical protein